MTARGGGPAWLARRGHVCVAWAVSLRYYFYMMCKVFFACVLIFTTPSPTLGEKARRAREKKKEDGASTARAVVVHQGGPGEGKRGGAH